MWCKSDIPAGEAGVVEREEAVFGDGGASIGKDGTAMYVGLLSMFSLQAFGVPLTPTVYALVLLTGALAWMDCSLWQTYDGGDHSIYVGMIEAGGVREGEPLIWFERGYRRIAD